MELSDSEQRRAAAGQLIQKYYYQLTEGCGQTRCDNPNCASSAASPPSLSPNEAAARAIQCVKVGMSSWASDSTDLPHLGQETSLSSTLPDQRGESQGGR